MNDELATVSGVYKKMELKEGLQVARITIEIPMSEALAFMNAFGTPDAAVPVPVALARLAVPSAGGAQRSASITTSPTPQDVAGDTPVPVKKNMKRSQIAHLKCQELEFAKWIADGDAIPEGKEAAYADMKLKYLLSIKSKGELDTDPVKAAAWDAMKVDYELRAYAR